MDTWLFFADAALLRFRGEDFLVGDSGAGAMLSSGSKIWVGSIISVFLALRPRPVVRGVVGSSAVFRLLDFVGLRCGAGVNSPPSSLSPAGTSGMSSSDWSTTIFLRVAALRDGRAGEMEAIG